jgi:SPP1 gp7 family putative phage head morphogenesis protein
MMMELNKLYGDLSLQFTEEGFNKADDKSKTIYKQQAKHRDELLDVIARILLTYTILDNVLSLSTTEKNVLKKDLSNVISNISANEFKQEKEIINKILEGSVIDKYYSDAYALSIGIDFKLQKLTDEQIKKIVNQELKNELWSNRLWKNKKELENTLKQEIERFLTGKTNVNKIKKVVTDRFNQSAYNTRRLVQTEVARCQNSVNDVFAEEHGVEEQMFTATLDNRTSDFCREHDGKVYKIDDPNKPYLPHHPFERSCYINVPFKGYKPKVRKDNITKELIPYITYEEWKQTKGIE